MGSVPEAYARRLQEEEKSFGVATVKSEMDGVVKAGIIALGCGIAIVGIMILVAMTFQKTGT